MTGPKNLKERLEFPLVFAVSTAAGVAAFMLVWLIGVLWELYRTIGGS